MNNNLLYCINIGDSTYFHSRDENSYTVVNSLRHATRIRGKKAADDLCSWLYKMFKVVTYKFEI